MPEIAGLSFDYLFSVANLTILPGALIRQAHKMAVNFHDGPLPEMAGLNAPVWAILEGRGGHAITWHEMTETVDAGRILKARSFGVSVADTAFSLNARCYEAGLDAFRELVAEIASDMLEPQPQDGKRVLYTGSKRPAGLGTLDFTCGAEEVVRVVRALDFGGYANPLSVAKTWTGTGFLAVRRAAPVAAGLGSQPGLVVEVDENGVTVAVADGAVRLEGLADLDGNNVSSKDAGFVVGQVLPMVADIGDAELNQVGRAERDWRDGLTGAVPALPPYPLSGAPGTGMVELPLAVDAADEVLAAAWLAWNAGLSGQQAGTLACYAEAAQPYLSSVRPVTVALPEDIQAGELQDAVAQAFEAARARAPMAADLIARLPDAEARHQARRALSVVVAGGGQEDRAAEAADIVLATAPARLLVRDGLYLPGAAKAIVADFSRFLSAFRSEPEQPVASLPLGSPAEAADVSGLPEGDLRLHQRIAGMAAAKPDALALEAGSVKLSYADLDERAEAFARALAARGAGRGKVVGLCLERSADLVVAMLAILKTGAAYLPLDPDYPADRIAYMIEDSGADLIVASQAAAGSQALDPAKTIFPDATASGEFDRGGSVDDLAYLIYTSGSTGRPKGVMVPHRPVMNFLAGMDGTVPLEDGARLLAVTSVSFDISVLEIFWTLSRGATVVLQTDGAGEEAMPDFSLFYFASEAAGSGHHAYRLLLEGARFADQNGFTAIWTPERHFHAFGGLYPNPAISAAAVAGITENIQLRAGSSVLPLHHPVRVAEDWALVDNLSNGRAGLAIASGWQPNDFIVRPDAFANRKEVMLEGVETLRKLWKGEKVSFPGHDGQPVEVEIHPKPMQKEMPVWLTAAGNPETFAAAARLGCGVLTHLLGQTFEEVAEKIRAYRIAWREAGHPGNGHVVLMLHTFIGETEEEVRAAARGPMKQYLKSAVDLVRRAAWTFPTIVERAQGAGMTPQEMFEKEELSAEDLDQLLEHAFERYYQTSGLFGTPESAKEIVRRVAEIGADEIGCLIDFGIDTDVVLANLPHIKALMDGLAAEGGVSRKASVAEDIVARGITHLQCTPSMASLLAADGPGKTALGHLDAMMVGGEALPVDLARELRGALPGALLNMYGPTETTVWSSVARLDDVGERVPLGQPIANTTLSIRSPSGRVLPDLVEGELWIGGEGVTDGYWQRPELTAERFVETDAGRFYRTGDLVRRGADGAFEFLGRIDNQVKIRGHRIELGEIEARLGAADTVREAVVKAVEFGPDDTRLIGYVTARGATPPVPGELRQALGEQLPEFMVPSQIVVLKEMPLTPNRKIDRKALPDPLALASTGEVEKAEDATEAAIAEIWAAALGLPEVSVTGNFFDLGGHSLLVVQVQRQMREHLKRDVGITDLFRFPTVRSLARHLAEEKDTQPTAANRGAARAAARLARMRRR